MTGRLRRVQQRDAGGYYREIQQRDAGSYYQEIQHSGKSGNATFAECCLVT